MKKLIIALLVLPIVLFAGDPIPGIGITVEQSPGGVVVKGKTNGRGEFIAKGLKEGDYKVTIEMNGVSCVIGDQVNEKITIPSSKSTASIKPIRIDLSAKSMFISKKGYDYYASKTREAGSGMATGKRDHEPVKFNKNVDKSSPKLASTDNNSTSEKLKGGNGTEHGIDCGGIVTITPMKGGDLRLKIVGKK